MNRCGVPGLFFLTVFDFLLNESLEKMLLRGLDVRFLAVLMWLCTNVKAEVKTVQERETVTEPVLKASALGIHDQLLAFFKGNSTSNRLELCAEYFCDNGACSNNPAEVDQKNQPFFQLQGDDVVLVIPNVNITNSGQYCVSLNGVGNIKNFTLDVYESTTETNAVLANSSVSTWLAPVIAVCVLLVIIGVLCWICIKKKSAGGTGNAVTVIYQMGED